MLEAKKYLGRITYDCILRWLPSSKVPICGKIFKKLRAYAVKCFSRKCGKNVNTEADESYTSHNTIRLDVEGTIKKLLTTDYVRNALEAAK